MAGDSLVAPGDSLVARLALHEIAVQAVEERRLLQQVDQRPVVERVHHDILPVVIYILEPLPEGLQHPPQFSVSLADSHHVSSLTSACRPCNSPAPEQHQGLSTQSGGAHAVWQCSRVWRQ